MSTLVRIQPLPLYGKARYGGLFCVLGELAFKRTGPHGGAGEGTKKPRKKPRTWLTRWRDVGEIRWRACKLRGMRSCENDHVTAVARLVTIVDVRDLEADAHTMSVSARHEAVLADGSRVLLLDGRGWTSALMRMQIPDDGVVREDVTDTWAVTSVEEIEQSARTVVGPDEPFAGYTREELEDGHWAHLSDVLRQHGVEVDARELKQLPHDVTLSERLLARVRS
jgi:hypothetical protein